jgi:hypothetical protein
VNDQVEVKAVHLIAALQARARQLQEEVIARDALLLQKDEQLAELARLADRNGQVGVPSDPTLA